MENSAPPVSLDPFRKFKGPPVPIDVMLETVMKVSGGKFKILEDPSGRLHGVFIRTRLFANDESVYVSDVIENAYRRLYKSVNLEVQILELRKSTRADIML